MKRRLIKYDVFLGAPPGEGAAAKKVEGILKEHGLKFFNPSYGPGESVITEASRRALVASRTLVIVAGGLGRSDPFSALLGLGTTQLAHAVDRRLGAEMGILIGAGLALGKPTYVLVDDPGKVRRADFPREVWMLPIGDAENLARNALSKKLSSQVRGRGHRVRGLISSHGRSTPGVTA